MVWRRKEDPTSPTPVYILDSEAIEETMERIRTQIMTEFVEPMLAASAEFNRSAEKAMKAANALSSAVEKASAERRKPPVRARG